MLELAIKVLPVGQQQGCAACLTVWAGKSALLYVAAPHRLCAIVSLPAGTPPALRALRATP